VRIWTGVVLFVVVVYFYSFVAPSRSFFFLDKLRTLLLLLCTAVRHIIYYKYIERLREGREGSAPSVCAQQQQ
jgi:hypothetical protein